MLRLKKRVRACAFNSWYQAEWCGSLLMSITATFTWAQINDMVDRLCATADRITII